MAADNERKFIQHTDDEKIAIAERVCQMYESQRCTFDSACAAAGITSRSFYLWQVQISAISERYKKAKSAQQAHFWENIIRPLADTALERLLKGEKSVEVKRKRELKNNDGQDELIETEEVTTERDILPNATITIFATKGNNPDRFIEKVEQKHEMAISDDSWFAKLPFEQQVEILKIRNAANATTQSP